LSERTVKAFTEPGFVADLKREYAEAHLPPQSEARLQHEYRTTRAALLGTLGRIYLEQGKIDRARAIFNQAEQNDPSSTAAAGLGAIAFKEGRLDAAYDNLLRARLTGALSPGDERTFESLFAKRYGDTSRLTTELDTAYRKLFPNPVHVEPYRPAGEPTGHTALLEVFTGAGCDPCAGADVAVDAIRERYSPQDLVVLMYHLHVPLPDPMTNADAVARAAFYKVPGTPTFVVDGSNQQTGGAAREDAERPYGRLTTLIEEALKEVPPAKLSATAARIGNIVKVHATVSDLKDPPGDLTLRVVLAERELRYGGENGIRFHPMVVRAVADFPFAGPGAPGADAGTDAEFDIGRLQASLRRYLDEYEQHNDRFGPVTFAEKMDGVDGRNLAVAALIQTSTDRRVLQSVLVDIAGDQTSR
jgi:tetratricopeptide (TPR) repeat protein